MTRLWFIGTAVAILVIALVLAIVPGELRSTPSPVDPRQGVPGRAIG